MYLFLLQKNIHHLVYVYAPHNKFRYVSSAETQLGKAYIQQDEIQHKLHNAFNTKIALLANTITVYNGQGITLEDIDFVLQESNKAAQLWAENHFQRYKIKLQISETNAKEWLKKMESNNKAAYPYLKKLIDEKYNT